MNCFNTLEKDIKKIVKNNGIPLINGNIGVGKTYFIKSLVQKSQKYAFYLFCPLELEELNSALFGIKNNPKKILIVDNLEFADKTIIQKLINYIPTKKISTSVIFITNNIYNQNIRTLKTKTTICNMPELTKSDLILFANKMNASKSILKKIKDGSYTNFSVIKNNLSLECDQYETDVYTGIKNPFKAMQWLLTNSKIKYYHLENIIESDQYFYTMGVFTNYLNTSLNLQSKYELINTLSFSDSIDYSSANIQNAILSKIRSYNTCSNIIKITFPNFKTNSMIMNYNIWKSIEYKDTISYLLRLFNNQKKNKLNTDYLNMLSKGYNIKIKDHEKLLTPIGSKKILKSKVHLKKILI